MVAGDSGVVSRLRAASSMVLEKIVEVDPLRGRDFNTTRAMSNGAMTLSWRVVVPACNDSAEIWRQDSSVLSVRPLVGGGSVRVAGESPLEGARNIGARAVAIVGDDQPGLGGSAASAVERRMDNRDQDVPHLIE